MSTNPQESTTSTQPRLLTSLDIEIFKTHIQTTHWTVQETYKHLCNTYNIAVSTQRDLENLRQLHEQTRNEVDDLRKRIAEYESIVDVLRNEKQDLQEQARQAEFELVQANNNSRSAMAKLVKLEKEKLILKEEVDPDTVAGRRINELEEAKVDMKAEMDKGQALQALMARSIKEMRVEVSNGKARESKAQERIKGLEKDRAIMAEFGTVRQVKIVNLERSVEELTQKLKDAKPAVDSVHSDMRGDEDYSPSEHREMSSLSATPSPRPEKRQRENAQHDDDTQGRGHLRRKCKGSVSNGL
jgi:DNA repair exonuclease SbcCD ATPase subunit